MNDEPIHEKAAARLDTGTRLASERTYLTLERTQMAWLRTALSLISFGFAISKFFEFLQEKQGEKAPLMSAPTVGIIMIVIGVVVLTLASIQHLRAMKFLRKECPDLPFSLAAVTGGFVAFLGILALFGAVLRG